MGYLQMSRFFFSFMAWEQAAADHGGISHSNDSIGVIVDYGSRVGKEEKEAMELTIDDFYNKTNQRVVLHLRDSHGDPLRARLSEAASAGHCRPSDLGGDRWPFLVQASPSRYWQMNVVAAIVGSWRWRWITVIYEDTDSAATCRDPPPREHQVGSEIGYLLALPPFTVNSSSPLSDELERLKGRQSRVFVLHSSLSMPVRLFQTANELGMMEEGCVWIITHSTTSLIHSVNSAIISSMQGILGKSFIPFALQAYDAVWYVALAMEAASSSQIGSIQPLLERIALTDFHALTSRIQFNRRSLAPLQTFQITNVIGKSYRELGFWFKGFGFSKTTNEKAKCEHLGYPLTHELIPYNGSYDSLVEQVHLKKCLEVEADDDHSISPDSLWVLFLATGATSTVSLAIYVARIWRLISAAMRSWIHHHAQRTRSSAGDIKRSSSLVELGTYRGSHGNA
ncbi:hypothetical protein AAG906_026981 [Vitis piasezkii]